MCKEYESYKKFSLTNAEEVAMNTINISTAYNFGNKFTIIPYPTAFPYGNGMVLHFYQQQESSMTETVHKVINKGLKAYV